MDPCKSAAPRSTTGRLYLTILAIGGDLALTAVQVAPIAITAFVGALFLNRVIFFWIAGAATLFFAWLSRPAVRFEGRELLPEEAPVLFSELASLRKRLGVPGHMQVFLDDSLNASASETKGFFGIAGTRRGLRLGIPLLCALRRDHALAVIAHEFGHFSRRHGRLGHWLYRAREGWIEYARLIGRSDSTLDQAAAWYAKRFVPFFSSLSFAHSRECEFEADSDAVHAVGSKSMAQALCRIAVVAKFWEHVFPRQILRLNQQMETPPPDFSQRFAQALRICPEADSHKWLDEALQTPSSTTDTHPSLAERLSSIGETAQLAAAEESAGAALLGPNWASVLGEFDDTWAAKSRADWRLEHLRYKHVARDILDADAATSASWTLDQRLARARQLLVHDPAAGLAELAALQGDAGHVGARLVYGSALLNEGDPAGIAILEKLAKECGSLRVPISLRMLRYYERKNDTDQLDRWLTGLDNAAGRRAEALFQFWKDADTGNNQKTSLDLKIRALLREATELDSCVSHACLFEGVSQLIVKGGEAPVSVPTHALVLAIDPAKMAVDAQDEEMIGARYENLLASLVPPDHWTTVRTIFVTELIPEPYQPTSPSALQP